MKAGSASKTGAALREVMRREVACIDHALAQPHDLDGSVHEARKAMRRLRALLGLCRDRFEGREEIDARLRSLGRGLSALRDSRASIDTARKIMELRDDVPWLPAVERLVQRRDRVVEHALASDPAFERRRARFAAIASVLEGWRWEALTASHLRREYKRGGKRADKAERRTRKTPTADNLHRWRRRLRTLRMQRDVVLEVLPKWAARSASAPREGKALHRLTDALGWRQDLEVLRGLLRPMRDLSGKAELLAGIRSEIAREDAREADR